MRSIQVPCRRPQRRIGASRTPICLLIGLALSGACTKICHDDGFAWQQDPSCQAVDSETESTGDSEASADSSSPNSAGEDGRWCVDNDGDGFGDPTNCADVADGEAPPPGTVGNTDDCDDGDDDTYPGAAALDDVDACMKDADDDDWGDQDPPAGVAAGSDCDDDNDDTYPGAAPKDDLVACMKDADGDDWGDQSPPTGKDGQVSPGSDCDDDNPNAWVNCGTCSDGDDDGWLTDCDAYPPDHPTPDCADDDPDTFPGAAPNDDAAACMTDADGDDWGADAPTSPQATPGTDCDDANAATYKGSAPKDDPDACLQDGDDDDYGDAHPTDPDVPQGSDCNDAHSQVNPTDSVLITAPINSGDISRVDPATGSVTPIASVDVNGFNPWIPTSVAVHPVNRTVVAALAFNDRLVTMDYCGSGAPTAKPMAHKKNLCGLAFDRAGDLYGVDGQVDQLLKFNDDGSIKPGDTKPLTFEGATLNVADCGMTLDCHEDRLLLSDTATSAIYVVNTADGTTTRLAAAPQEMFGGGLAYDPVTRHALSCNQTAFYSLALDGTNDFSQLPDLESPADDLDYAPGCE